MNFNYNCYLLLIVYSHVFITKKKKKTTVCCESYLVVIFFCQSNFCQNYVWRCRCGVGKTYFLLWTQDIVIWSFDVIQYAFFWIKRAFQKNWSNVLKTIVRDFLLQFFCISFDYFCWYIWHWWFSLGVKNSNTLAFYFLNYKVELCNLSPVRSCSISLK